MSYNPWCYESKRSLKLKNTEDFIYLYIYILFICKVGAIGESLKLCISLMLCILEYQGVNPYNGVIRNIYPASFSSFHCIFTHSIFFFVPLRLLRDVINQPQPYHPLLPSFRQLHRMHTERENHQHQPNPSGLFVFVLFPLLSFLVPSMCVGM